MVSSGVDTVRPGVGVKSRVSTKPTSSSTTTVFEDSARRRPPLVAYVEEDSGHLDSRQPLDERKRAAVCAGNRLAPYPPTAWP